jgi:predicted ATP-dependent protease
VIIPQENEKDLAEIPDNVKQNLTIIPVRWIDQVLEIASPRKVISPVMATSALTGTSVKAEITAVHMPMPALGPSLGVAPSGT